MNNKPVAWMVNDKPYKDIFEAEHYSTFTNKPMIPLYIHPAKTLTPITDEEIKERVKNSINGDWVDGYYDGVRWAEEKLRKAQEK